MFPRYNSRIPKYQNILLRNDIFLTLKNKAIFNCPFHQIKKFKIKSMLNRITNMHMPIHFFLLSQQPSEKAVFVYLSITHAEGLMLKPKLQYVSHLMWRVHALEKNLMLGKIENKKRRGDRKWLSSSHLHLRLRIDKGLTNLYVLLVHCSPKLC